MSNPGNIIGGHKANLNNPNTSDEAKQHSKEVLDQEFDGGNIPQADQNKNPGNVAGGLKATLNNPNVSEEAKQSAKDRLNDM
ncbi:conidiation-specific protein 6 [Neofusicoccum parvum]|uniref:Conidiation-specific protein 6 n=3 Tax=Neofusicoccum TaxID=407951 RepID=A0ABR3TE65_9PEZI|nr:putative conidiation-specific protein 6 protein [Neofusicoccum parvum UCRNP2]GME28616.1 conidiation-specific protein 6 [Neofusicoccum parvum]GME58786.1 conidiation-specific protein 6 [Neofusicoccum parvum]